MAIEQAPDGQILGMHLKDLWRELKSKYLSEEQRAKLDIQRLRDFKELKQFKHEMHVQLVFIKNELTSHKGKSFHLPECEAARKDYASKCLLPLLSEANKVQVSLLDELFQSD